jgi:hypothetical protein
MPLPHNNRLCGATTRRGPGQACKNPAMENGRCRMHGGLTPKGTDLPQFKHGRYSRSVPDRLVSRYEEALSDEERHDLRDEIALSEAKVSDLLRNMESGESDRLWLELRKMERQLRAAPPDKRAPILAELLDVVRRGGDEAQAWADVDRWIYRKQRAVEADVRVAQVKQEMVSAEEVMALVAAILDSIRRHVEDQGTRSALARDIRALGSGAADVIPLRRDDEGSEK